MRCEQIQKHVADYLAEELPPAVASDVLEHLESCDSCREEVEGMNTLWSDMAEIPLPHIDHAAMRRRFEATVTSVQPIHQWKGRFRMFLKPIMVIGAALTLLVGGGLFFERCELALACPVQHSENPQPTEAVAAGGGHLRGSSDAPVTLVEFGDFECPPCAFYQPIVMKLLQEHPEKVQLEFHHFPLTTIHPNALAAAVAAEAAGDQGQFWAMHDLLYSNQQKWSHKPNAEAIFKEFASQLGLDADQFATALHAPETRQRVTEDIARGRDRKVSGTPSFFINGMKIANPPQTEQEFFEVINR
jgi:protein-disulfide isomerase